MTREDVENLHKLIDQLAEEGVVIDDTTVEVIGKAEPERELPKDKRVVRTKSSGDRVYLLDEVKKTRQWVTNPKILESLGFSLTDVKEVEDNEMLKFQMGPALYRVEDAQPKA